MKLTYVPIVFAFDNNFSIPIKVTITSLFKYALDNTIYKVYCIVSNDIDEKNLDSIIQLSKNQRHEIIFLKANNHFNQAHVHRKITQAAYYRLMLHELIPLEDKVIYADVDILFNGDLKELFEVDLKKNILAGVKNLYIHQVFDSLMLKFDYWSKYFFDLKDDYINSGFLIMNLKEIRKTKIWEKWIDLSKNQWEFHDQDILNFTCKNKIHFLPPKYNMTYPLREDEAYKWGLFNENLLLETPIVYHFTASKPWHSKYLNQSDVWWVFLKENTDLYDYFLQKYFKDIPFKKRFKGSFINKAVKFKQFFKKNLSFK
jgi:lipopolysaccharide biosynthesis glycosyltransferase